MIYLLVQFSVSNFKSFKDEQIFSMVATNLSGHEDDNLIIIDDSRYLKSAVIYGANASGKSNLIKAISYMIRMIEKSVQYSIDNQERLDTSVFMMHEEMLNKPSTFEIIINIDGTNYRYTFSILNTRIILEEFYFTPNSREALLFSRSLDTYKFGSYFENDSKDLKSKTNDNALFLTVLAQFNNKTALKFMNSINKINTISGSETRPYEGYTTRKVLEDETFKQKVSDMIKKADFGIEGIDAEKLKTDFEFPEGIPENLKALLKDGTQVYSIHKVKTSTDEYKLKRFNLMSHESEGTRKYYGLAGPILDTLEEGGTLIVDELDAKLHPLMTRYIVLMFNSKEHNPNNAQLIFATHDTQFLNQRFFRRDQIWFVEKNVDKASEIYALSDYRDEEGNTVRKNQSIEMNYLQGKYGGIPFIDW